MSSRHIFVPSEKFQYVYDVVRVVGILLLLCGLLIVPAIGVGAATTGEYTVASKSSIADHVAPTITTDKEENETVRHRNPEEYAADGDSGVEAWLSDRLSGQLQDSAFSLSENEYDLARDFVGEEYRDRLSQYVEVAGDTEGSSDDEDEDEDDLGETFNETAEEQERLTDLIEAYEQTLEEYEAARQAGDDELALELARELEDLAAEIEAAGGTIRTNYDIIELETGQDFTEADSSINESTSAVEESQTIVREQQFIETALILEPEGETASFLDPLTIAGSIETADESVIADEEIRLQIDGETVDTRTDESGAFAVDFQPLSQQRSLSNITVAYIPDRQSTYLGTQTDVNVSIQQVQPTISSLETAETTAYSDTLPVEGELTVDDVPVDDVSVEASIDGSTIGTISVTDGTFADTVRIPANVRDGERSLTVTLPYEDRALAATNTTTPISVSETQTSLEMDAAPIANDDGNYTVNGTLTTADGDAIPDQSVEVLVDGESVESVTTDSDGTFSERVVGPPVADDDELQIGAVYDGEGTSLTSAQAETIVQGQPAVGESSSLFDRIVSPWTALLGLIVLAIGSGAMWWRRDRHETESPGGDRPTDYDGSTPMADPSAATAAATETPSDTVTTARVVDALLTRADDHLSDDRPKRAIRTAYSAVRQAWPTTADRDETLTHWEFYQHHSPTDDGPSKQDEQLRDVTTAYEQAAFTPNSVSSDNAEAVLDMVRRLCGRSTPESGVDEVDSSVADD